MTTFCIDFSNWAIDESLKTIEHLDEEVDRLQDAVLEHASPSLRTIFRIRAVLLRKMLSPQHKVLNRLARDSHRCTEKRGLIFAIFTMPRRSSHEHIRTI